MTLLSKIGALGVLLAWGGLAAAQSADAPAKEEFADKVRVLAETELLSWVEDPIIIDAIREQNIRNEGMTNEEVDRLDKAWRAERKTSHKPMIWDLLDRLHSILLRDRREGSDGVVTEIIVMDRYGLNAAISDETSDFYQGDEAKYQETYLIGSDAVHVGDYEYDDSTQKWQTQVSLTVNDPENGEPIGAVTFGIDLSVLK
ncbi:hypothetical protein LNKW23_40930 [Paralimibaculum aggregatum]|uniref:Uncharacterized protein n=1 Tax=Paralimibaculum aggregatum TaxID=3036245 RepID=A0ABQ6LR96_9RHOB|nr:PDC sensor domain-containing protein [Limibaculum sp. NKW23]GMG84877.1 hypothetical protein LNKW23_40930 [Limibaculum sp. NKW23]